MKAIFGFNPVPVCSLAISQFYLKTHLRYSGTDNYFGRVKNIQDGDAFHL